MEMTLEKKDCSINDVQIPVQKSNNGNKPNKCSQCDFTSSGTYNLRRHLKAHRGERSNKCNQCDYATSRAGDLRRHLKAHSGEKLNKVNLKTQKWKKFNNVDCPSGCKITLVAFV